MLFVLSWVWRQCGSRHPDLDFFFMTSSEAQSAEQFGDGCEAAIINISCEDFQREGQISAGRKAEEMRGTVLIDVDDRHAR